ncbi:uncharacterized protein N7482_000343 [Penicillium canariense]|uniref:CFEM domain-containing protein n=1 Tax=Penicillium canariense TaxID=189055 RepID=A0A9W9IF49_9EURO|nr:uncharacterized protein N7482_000343 [Penicillium canariense]KAJ5174466.1 hypothetical protein N7482_000343 [Penicillium canariense]
MLLPPVYRILAAVLPLVALCTASADNTSDTSDSSLWNAIPDCAKTCVSNFIEGQYTSDECASASDIKCLCRTKTVIGLTLGEAALSCLYALCSQKDISSKASSVYRVCDSVSGAIPETHATITATTFDPPSSTTTTAGATTSVSTTSQSTSHTALGTSTTTSTSPTTTTSPIITFQPTSDSGVVSTTTSADLSSTTPTSTATSSVSNDGSAKHNVSAGTVIGVSVASGVAGTFIIGVAVFFCCKRWRKNRTTAPDSDQDFFEIGGTMSEPPGFSQPPSRRSSPAPGPNPTGPSSFSHAGGHQEASELPCTHTPTSQLPPPTAIIRYFSSTEKLREQEQVGLAVSSEDDWETSPRRTLSSQNTLAELIPTQSTGLYPKPLKWCHRPISGDTLFEEDEFQQAALEKRPNGFQRSESPNVMTGLPANPRALKNGFPAQKFLRTSALQRPTPSQTPIPPSAQAFHQGTLTPGFSTTALRSSPLSNSDNTPHNSSGSSHRNSANTHLTTPFSTGQGCNVSGMSLGTPNSASAPAPVPRPGPGPGPSTRVPPSHGLGLGPAAEIVSRPRVVRGDDIKRVQIRSSPRPPNEVATPYCPEDFWLERGRQRPPAPNPSVGLPYPSEASPGTVLYPRSPKKRPQGAETQRWSATGPNLTPSKRGQDLILRVD